MKGLNPGVISWVGVDCSSQSSIFPYDHRDRAPPPRSIIPDARPLGTFQNQDSRGSKRSPEKIGDCEQSKRRLNNSFNSYSGVYCFQKADLFSGRRSNRLLPDESPNFAHVTSQCQVRIRQRVLLASSRLHSSRPRFSWQSNAWRRYSPRPREPVSRRHEWGHTEMPQTAPEFSILRFPRGGVPLQEANGDVPLDAVAFSRLWWLWWGRISIELLGWGRTFLNFLGYDSSSYLWLANVPECLYCRWKIKCSSFHLKKLGQFIKIESD